MGGLVEFNVRPRSKEVSFSVCDGGIGIPTSLKSVLDRTWRDNRILEEAIKEGVTRGVGQGNGLFGSAQICALSEGAISIHSETGVLSISRGGRSVSKLSDIPFPGTIVNADSGASRPPVPE